VKRNLAVIIPVYNEAASIGSVVLEIRLAAPQAAIVIVDDGCSDDSADVAEAADAIVIRLPYNLGIGGAVQTGYRFASELGYDIVVRLDGDGQHDPAQMEGLIRPILSGQADVVIGSRFVNEQGYQASVARSLGIKLFATLVSLVTHQRFTDTTSGFQAANRSAAAFLARHLPSDYPEIEGLVLLCRAGFRVFEVPVTMRPRRAGRSSITPLRSIYYTFKVLLAILIGLLRRLPEEREVIVGAR
jgi:glycosyltransferase involved in cell wall biosynthesis